MCSFAWISQQLFVRYIGYYRQEHQYYNYSQGDFAFFRPAGVTHCASCRQIWYCRGKQQSLMLCQISGGSVHICGFVTPKTSKIPNFANLFAISQSFYAPMGSTKMFQIWCHSMPNWGSYTPCLKKNCAKLFLSYCVLSWTLNCTLSIYQFVVGWFPLVGAAAGGLPA